ncbi:Putative uncharacterized protein [Leuconostoc citreum LBAE C10]|uniref:hypothetical protein n=1 Tax=Leuconostoc citreum TaxID=33964 RepID=UPI0002466362|nr:hypothetical protein [Leuconostoc citreum]CCF25615.1 Putative uncharacterized protein [Leuconostoc citreum LBAE C10]
MTETVVHVTTLDQWKSVLDVWFAQGYEWFSSKGYREDYFRNGSRQLRLNPINKITYSGSNLYSEDDCIEYADFMSQQEKTMAKETYYITRKQFDLIEKLKAFQNPLFEISHSMEYVDISTGFDSNGEKSLLRYLGGYTSVEFKVKKLYRLWRIDDDGDRVYMEFVLGTPNWTLNKRNAFTAPREEIEKHKTPAWEIEEVD